MPKIPDSTRFLRSLKYRPGQRFGRLVLQEYLPNKRLWKVLCDCGTVIEVSVGRLTNGNTSSCGCLRRETTGNMFRTHGEAGGPEYQSWIAMKARCEKREEYKNVSISPAWRSSYRNFLSDMGRKPLGGDYVIERINPYEGYHKDNCLWIPRESNKPDSRNGELTVWGKSKSDPVIKSLLVQLQNTQRLEITKASDIAALSTLDRFWYWVAHRHEIWLKKTLGFPKPWTIDPILQGYFFTSPYRENDKVTVWFRENIREPLRDRPEVIFATVAFRWFNLPEPTGRILMTPYWDKAQRQTLTPLGKLMLSPLCDWKQESAFNVLDAVRKEGGQIFTGAFMINSPPRKGKLEAIIERVTNVWNARKDFLSSLEEIGQPLRMKEVHGLLTEFDGLGGFMAYEVVCDLRYTYLLENAPDKMTWCNPGPGAIRGMCRILGIPFDASNNSTSPPCPPNFMEECQKLLKAAPAKLRGMPPMEMREIEHSLCETDKYNRILLGEGRAKRRYNGN